MDWQERLMELFPSKSLCEAIRKTGHRFSELDMVKLAYLYARSFDERIALLQGLQGAVSPEVAARAAFCVNNLYAARDTFLAEEPHTVYELHIKANPKAYEERVLCTSFEAARAYIPLFYKEYGDLPGFKKSDDARFKVYKRQIWMESTPLPDEYLGFCEMRAEDVILSYTYVGIKTEDISCGQDDPEYEYDITSNPPIFPVFLQDRDVVIYEDYHGEKRFGITLAYSVDPDSAQDCYVIPLDSETARLTEQGKMYWDHDHIAPPYVERSSPDALPEKLKQNYVAFCAYLDELKQERKRGK